MDITKVNTSICRIQMVWKKHIQASVPTNYVFVLIAELDDCQVARLIKLKPNQNNSSSPVNAMKNILSRARIRIYKPNNKART